MAARAVRPPQRQHQQVPQLALVVEEPAAVLGPEQARLARVDQALSCADLSTAASNTGARLVRNHSASGTAKPIF